MPLKYVIVISLAALTIVALLVILFKASLGGEQSDREAPSYFVEEPY